MRSTGRISIAVAALVALALSAASASAAPQGPWVQPAADLSATGQTAAFPQVATAADGTTTVVWRRYNGSRYIIQEATRPPNGTFGVPTDLSAAGQTANDPQIASSPDSSFTVVWTRSNGSNDIVQAATRPPGGPFGAPVDLSTAGQTANDPEISTATDGTTTVVWSRSNGTNDIIQAATRPPGGSFGAPVNLSLTPQDAADPQIVTAPDGTTTVVWSRSNGTNDIIQQATRASGGSFTAPSNLSDTGQDASVPQIATAADGTTTVVWNRYDGSNDVIQQATRPSGGSFAAPTQLSQAGQNAYDPQVAMSPDGATIAVWQAVFGAKAVIQTGERPAGGSFGAPNLAFSTCCQDAYEPQVTASPDGTMTVIWRRYDTSNYIIQSRTSPLGSGFGNVTDLSAVGKDAFSPQVAVEPDGRVTAVWYRFNGSHFIVQTISSEQPSFILYLGRPGSGDGTVTSTPAGIDCGSDCSSFFPSFATVMLTATPDAGSTFEGWGGDCEGSVGEVCEVSMLLRNQSVTAEFTAIPPDPEAVLRFTRVTPRNKKVKRGETIRIKVTATNIGDATASNTKLCLVRSSGVKRALKMKGSRCQRIGSLGPGASEIRTFKLKATRKARKGRKFVGVHLSANGVTTLIRGIIVKVR